MSVAANTPECFYEFIGQKVTGVLIGAVPANRPDIAAGTKTLIFEDGRGLTISSKGSYWIDSADDVARAVRRTAEQLEATKKRLAGVLSLAGGEE